MPVPVPHTSAIRAWLKDHPEAGVAGVISALSTLYYALPDFLRRRPLRIAARVGCVAAISSLAIRETTTPVDEAAPDVLEPEEPSGQESPSGQEAPNDQESPSILENPIALGAMIAAGITVLAGTIALEAAVERKIFARGERRRAAGVRLAHTRQALWLGPLSGAATYISLR